MASESLEVIFDAINGISQTLSKIETDVGSLSNEFAELDASMSSNTAISQQNMVQYQQLQSQMEKYEDKISGANRELAELTGQQQINVASAATQSGSMKLAAEAIDEAGDEALTTAAQMGVLDTTMKELSLSGSALSVNIGAFNVSLRNLAPLVPIAASMGTVVTVMGSFIASLGAATVALGGFMAAGALGFVENLKDEFEGLTESGETLEAVLGGLRDLFTEALEPLQSTENTKFFVNVIEGAADLVNRLAQAINQMRDDFMPLFTGISDIISDEFDAIANGISDMMDTMNPVLLGFFEWFMTRLPDALRFMARVTEDVAGPIATLGDSFFDILTSIIESASAILQGLGPAFSLALDLASSLVDVFNILSNGFLQAALFIGGLSVAVTKFVGIANTMSNILITSAQRMRDFGAAIRTADGLFGSFRKKVTDSFKHLSALGKVLTGQMTLAEASGKKHKELAEEIEDAAQSMKGLQSQLENVKHEYAQLIATVEGGDVGDVIADDVNRAADEAEDAASRIGNINKMSGTVPAPKMSGFKDIDTKRTVGKEMAESRRRAARNMLDANRKFRNAAAGDMFGELARGSDESSNALRKVGAAFGNVSDKLGPFSSDTNTVTGALSDLGESALKPVRLVGDKLSNAFGKAGDTAINSVPKLAKAGLAYVREAFKTIVATGAKYAYIASTYGVTTALSMMISSLWKSVTAFGATAASALGAAATFLGSLVPASLTLGTALNVAFVGIPALIGAIVAVAGLAVGVLGNLDGITSTAKSTFDGFKNAIKQIGNALLSAAVPAWNMFVDIAEAAIAPFLAIWDGLKMIGRALGIVSDDGSGAGGIISMLIGAFGGLMDMIGGLINFIAPVFSFIGNMLYKYFILPFKVIAASIKLVKAIFGTLFSALISRFPIIGKIINTIVGGFRSAVNWISKLPQKVKSLFNGVSNFINNVMDDAMEKVQTVLDVINKIIRGSNAVLGTDFDTLSVEEDGRQVSKTLSDAKTSASDVRENTRSDSEDAGEDVETDPKVDMTFDESVEQNVDVTADPEQKEQLKRIVKDAMEEANSVARRQQGMGR